MIKSITITNYVGESLTIELERPWVSGFAITNVTGLGPPEASINTTELATADGSLYNSARVNQRNIVMEMQFYQTNQESIEAIRLKSYRYFPIKKPINFLIETDRRRAEITGYVETNEPEIFSENEGCQISIISPFPYFRSFETQITTFAGLYPLFEFPFENNSVTEKLIEMGDIRAYASNSIPYVGDAETGFVIQMHAYDEVRNIMIYDDTNGGTMFVDSEKLEEIVEGGFQKGDNITISTIDRTAVLERNGKEFNILNAVIRGTTWFKLARGVNDFYYIAEKGGTNLSFKIINQVYYEGV